MTMHPHAIQHVPIKESSPSSVQCALFLLSSTFPLLRFDQLS